MKATEAREIATGVQVKASMFQIRLAIKRAAENGDTFIYIHEVPTEKIKSILVGDGYSITDVSERNDVMYKISW